MQTRTRHPVLPLFVLAPAADLARELNLPAASENLFQRLIRNPRAESDQAKERECAEMLCAVLQSAATLRLHLLRCLGHRVGFDVSQLEGLRFRFATEQPIGTKRDDLRIVGVRDDSDDPYAALIWTVEVKVGASFHETGAQRFADDDDGDDGFGSGDAAIPVNQLVNYDCWLARQQAAHRAGFVLALRDCSSEIPDLQCQWSCLTWTRLGEEIAAALQDSELPEADTMLARHALGFIRKNLWRTSEMSNAKLDFNDVSLIRAFGALSQECEAKVNALVGPLVKVLKQSGIGVGEVEHRQRLFKNDWSASEVVRALDDECSIHAGIGCDPGLLDYLSVWIESPAKHPRKQALKSQLRESESRLHKLNPRWKLTSQSAEAGGAARVDAELTVPLGNLMVADDQHEYIRAFVTKALNDLKESGVIDAFNRTIGSGKSK